jgi:hypothetical protein
MNVTLSEIITEPATGSDKGRQLTSNRTLLIRGAARAVSG